MPKEIRQPEQKLNSEPQPIDTTSCPNIGNTNVVCSQSLLTLDKLFDKIFGSLDGCSFLSHVEYLEHKKFSLSSGLFAFQVQKYGWCL